MCSWHEQLSDVVGMRPQRATTSVRQKMTVVSKIRGISTSERLMHEPRDLERDSLTNWPQPVQLPQNWCDVVATTGACDQASGSVLHRLKALKKSVTDTIKQWVTVVQATRHECLDKRLGGIHGQRTDYWSAPTSKIMSDQTHRWLEISLIGDIIGDWQTGPKSPAGWLPRKRDQLRAQCS